MSQPMPITFSFDKQFDDMPLLSVLHKGCEVALCRISGTFEVTATGDGDWHVSDLWIFDDRSTEIHVSPRDPIYAAITDAIEARYGRAIEQRIGEEIADHAVPGGL